MNNNKRNRKGFSLKGLKPYYIIIGIIIILLTVILVTVKRADQAEVVSEYETFIETAETPEQLKQPDTVEPEEETSGPEAVIQKPATADKPDLVFVIDDVGNSIEQLKPFLEIPYPVTFAIMPDRKYTTQCASMIKAAGKEYILHQPMEAVGGSNPGASAIYTDMTEAEIISTLKHNFSQLPSAGGLNNHMGSAVTTDIMAMNAVMGYLSENNLFFLDSFTISNSLGAEAAEKQDVRYMKRNSMFLDNENDHDSIQNAIDEGKKAARKNGHAVMIGHVMTGELAEIMLELYPNFIEDGFSLKEISELFIEMNSFEVEE